MEFLGYERPDGGVGVRNHVALIVGGACANELAFRIANEVGGRVTPLLHNLSCDNIKPDRERALRAMVGLGTSPNVAAAIVVGIGCEGVSCQDIAEGIAKCKKPVELITLDREGDYQATVNKGVRVAQQMQADASLLRRQAFDLSHLTLAMKCGGSDATSALACNPVVGWAVDAIIAEGGSAVFSETTEVIGAEHILAKRAADQRTAQHVYEVVTRMEKRIKDAGVDIRGSEPTPANIQGGLTTLEEKSLGAIIKSGTTPLRGVLEWGEKLEGKGLFFMDGSANPPQIFLGLAAAGAQILTFGFGGGLPARFRSAPGASFGGLPILPVIKILSNPKDAKAKEYFDMYVGAIIENRESMSDAGERLLKEIIAVASGKMTKLEMFPHYPVVLDMYCTGPIL